MTNGHWRGWARRKMSRECDGMWKTSHYHPFTAPGWVIVGVAAACVMTGMLVGGWRTRSIWWHLSAWVAPLLQTILFINSIILIFINTNMLLMSTKCCSFTKDSICLWQHQPEPALSWGNPLWCLFNPSIVMIIILVKGHTSHLGRRLLCVLTVDVFLTRSDSQNCYFLGAVTLWRWWKWKDGDFDKRLMMYWLLNLSWCFPMVWKSNRQVVTIINIQQYTIYNIYNIQYTSIYNNRSLTRSLMEEWCLSYKISPTRSVSRKKPLKLICLLDNIVKYGESPMGRSCQLFQEKE